MRPVLGLIACNRRVGSETAQAVMNRYAVAAMRHADAAALIVPALPELMRAEEVAPRLDGLLLTGSPSNVEPVRYGNVSPGDGPFDPARDAMVAALVQALTALDKPVFGVCRGFQELNVAFGGTLRRDLGEVAAPHHAPASATFDEQFEHRHAVSLTPGGLFARAFATPTLTVNSVHFQGVDRLGEGLTVEARAPDGVVEAVSARIGRAPVIAVQWHPEWDADTNADSQTFFHLMGRALRGDPLIGDQA